MKGSQCQSLCEWVMQDRCVCASCNTPLTPVGECKPYTSATTHTPTPATARVHGVGWARNQSDIPSPPWKGMGLGCEEGREVQAPCVIGMERLILELHSPWFPRWKMLFHPPGMEVVDGCPLWFLQWVPGPRHPLVPAERDAIWDGYQGAWGIAQTPSRNDTWVGKLSPCGESKGRDCCMG